MLTREDQDFYGGLGLWLRGQIMDISKNREIDELTDESSSFLGV